jgi:hypothetical protein
MTVVPHPCEATKFIWELLFPVGNHAAERARTRDRWPPLRERSPPELRSVPGPPRVLVLQREAETERGREYTIDELSLHFHRTKARFRYQIGMHLKVRIFSLSPSHQFLAACIEY